jgi:hypothetical protein
MTRSRRHGRLRGDTAQYEIDDTAGYAERERAEWSKET